MVKKTTVDHISFYVIKDPAYTVSKVLKENPDIKRDRFFLLGKDECAYNRLTTIIQPNAERLLYHNDSNANVENPQKKGDQPNVSSSNPSNTKKTPNVGGPSNPSNTKKTPNVGGPSNPSNTEKTPNVGGPSNPSNTEKTPKKGDQPNVPDYPLDHKPITLILPPFKSEIYYTNYKNISNSYRTGQSTI